MISYGMLLTNNNRSKSYLQNLIRKGFFPGSVLVLNEDNRKLPEHSDNEVLSLDKASDASIQSVDNIDAFFDESQHIMATLKTHNISYRQVDTLNVNSPEVTDILKKFPEKYFVYSGPGGTILSSELTSLKKFLHVHPGWLPNYKGSTTIYYSMLIEQQVAASIIIMSDQIDKGDILYRKKYVIDDSKADFDYVVDPCVRAATLISLFEQWQKNRPKTINHEEDIYPYFYIVHPMLKHLVLVKHMQQFPQKGTKS